MNLSKKRQKRKNKYLCLMKGMILRMKLINIGFGNIISVDRVVSIVSPDSAPIKRMIQEAKDNRTAIDATYGRRTRAVIIMDSGHIVLSAIQPETIAGRIDKDITQELEEKDRSEKKW